MSLYSKGGHKQSYTASSHTRRAGGCESQDDENKNTSCRIYTRYPSK